MHRYRYEWSRIVGKQYIELFLLKVVIVKLKEKRKKRQRKISA